MASSPSTAPSPFPSSNTITSQEFSDFLLGLVRPVAAMALVAVAAGISWYKGLRLEKEMAVAVARAFVQLIGIGFALQFVFAQKGYALIIVSIVCMISIAGFTAGRRAKQIPGSFSIATTAITISTVITLAALVLLKVFPFQARYIIPIAGMIVGNSMNVTGVTMRRLREDMRLQSLEIEAALALGANPRQATGTQVRRALAMGMQPGIDSTKTIGLVALPGAMTGMILGGASPLEAVQLQIVVVYMLLMAATFSGLVATYLCSPRFFTKAYQIIPEAIAADKKK